MRERIVDYKEIKILKAQVAKSSDPGIKRLMQQPEQHIQTFNDEHEFKKEKLQNDIQKGKRLLRNEEISW
jgi:hypothetical protein